MRSLTVGDLIEALAGCDPDTPIRVNPISDYNVYSGAGGMLAPSWSVTEVDTGPHHAHVYTAR